MTCPVVGASVTPALLGLNPRRSPLRAQQELLGAVEREPGGVAAKMGQLLERTVLRSLVEALDVEVLPGAVDEVGGHDLRLLFPDAEVRSTGLSLRHGSRLWEAASVDGLIRPAGMSAAFVERYAVDVANGEHLITEAKTTGFASEAFGNRLRQKWGRPGTDAVPPDFAVQVQQQIDVVDDNLRRRGLGFCRRAILRVLGPDLPFVDYVIARNETAIAAIVEEMTTIVEVNLIGGVPLPAKTAADYGLLARVTARPGQREQRRRATFDEDAVVAEWLAAKAARERYELAEARCKAQLVESIGEMHAIDTPFGPVVLTIPTSEPVDEVDADGVVSDLRDLASACAAQPGLSLISGPTAQTLRGLISRRTWRRRKTGRVLIAPTKKGPKK